MSVASTVLSIPELLELILSSLPPLDIIHYQLVNRTWHTLILNSPLLQYKSWQSPDSPDPIHHVQPNDLIPDLDIFNSIGTDEERAYYANQYIYNLTTHLNPIIVAREMQDLPQYPRFSFDPDRKMDTDGFGGFFSMRPVLLRALIHWAEKNKRHEHKWKDMSLFRPEARCIQWEIPSSDDGSIVFNLEAKYTDDPNALRYSSDYIGNDVVVNKQPSEPLILTLGDLLGRLDKAWGRWKDSEREIYYLSHDGAGCDYNLGLPDGCLDSDEEDDEEGEERTKFGFKMTKGYHINHCVMMAS